MPRIKPISHSDELGSSGYSGISGYSGYSGSSGISGYSQDHSTLLNLEYDDAGHIGFQKKLIWESGYGTFIIEQ